MARSSLLTRARELSTLIPRQRDDKPSKRTTVHARLVLTRELWRARLPQAQQEKTRENRRPRQPRWRRVPEPDEAGQRWRGRPFVAGCLKALVLLIPAAAAILTTALLNWRMEPPTSVTLRVGWWLILLAVSTVVATAVQTQSRRLLPLAVLFKLTLVFPDEAPSRYKMARAAANPERLRELARGRSLQAQAATHVLAWVSQLSRHDRHTRGHSERVRVFADMIAEQMKITGIDRDKLRWASLLHDIGKLRVPAAVLNKPAKPTRSEWDVLREHPAIGMSLVGPLANWLGPWAGGIADHHERYDGTGYPNGLSGDRISLAGRIVAVADSYETMTAARAYKRPMAAAAGRAELARCAGTHFDPVVVRAFLEVGLPRLLHGIGPISFLVHLPFLTRLPEAGLGFLTAAGQMAAPVAAGLTAASVAGAGVVVPTASSLPTPQDGTHASSVASAHPSSGIIRGLELSQSRVTRSSTKTWSVSAPAGTAGAPGSVGRSSSSAPTGSGTQEARRPSTTVSGTGGDQTQSPSASTSTPGGGSGASTGGGGTSHAPPTEPTSPTQTNTSGSSSGTGSGSTGGTTGSGSGGSSGGTGTTTTSHGKSDGNNGKHRGWENSEGK